MFFEISRIPIVRSGNGNLVTTRTSGVEKLLTPPLVIVVCAVLVTAVIDVWKFKIHNAVTFPLLLTGVALPRRDRRAPSVSWRACSGPLLGW